MPEDDKPSGGSSAPPPRLKVNLPSAQGIKRPDFTPHGISSASSRRTPNRPSPLTAAQAKRRRRMTIAALVAAALAVAGGTAWYLTRPGPTLQVSGAFGKEPKVEIPKGLHPGGKLKTTVLTQGTGPKLAADDLAYIHMAYYRWPAKDAGPSADPGEEDEENKDGKLGSTYGEGGPRAVHIGRKDLQGIDKTLDKALTGQTVGSRVMIEVPPADGFGKDGQPEMGISGTDTILFVMDIIKSFPKNSTVPGEQKKFSAEGLPTVTPAKDGLAPKVTIPEGVAPPDKLVVKTLVEGDGPALAKGDTAVTHYKGVLWRNGKEFDSSWKRDTVQPFEVGTGATVPGFDKGLLGKKVGSRVMLILPPKEGYGKEGQKQAGIKGDDTLVFIVDILGTAPK